MMFSDRILNILYTRLAHDINQMKIIVNVLGRERERRERISTKSHNIYVSIYYNNGVHRHENCCKTINHNIL